MATDVEKSDVNMVEQSDQAEAQLGHLANQEDHEIGMLQSFKRFPWACVWCLFPVWCVVCVSFENQASGNIIGVPEFRKDFGYFYDGAYVLPADWQSAFSGAPVASAVIGALGSGQIADWLGRRTVIIISLIISYAAITIEFVSTTNGVFFAGKFLNGFPTGAMASVAVTYIGEITPLALRGLFTCFSALSYTIGPLIAAIIVNATGTYENRWAYRAIFCAQYGVVSIAALFVFFMPESPWWLASKDRNERALKSLHRLGYNQEDSHKKLALIHLTLEEIRRETDGVTYLECFRKSNLRRTMISIAPLCIQSLCGIMFMASYFAYYVQIAGYSTSMSFQLQITQNVVSLVGNVMSWALIDRVGRRDLTFWGLVILTVILLLTGGLAVAGTPGAIKGTVAMILVYCWWYNMNIGATAFTLLCEVSTSRLRVKTIAIGLATQNALNMMWFFVFPYLFNPDKANLGAKIAFIFGGFAIISLVFLWFCLPETAGRSYEELDEMFAKAVPARLFKSFKPDAQAKGEAVKQAMEEETKVVI